MLDVGESFTCTFSTSATSNTTNTATASGTGGSTPTNVDDQDSATVNITTEVLPNIHVTKAVCSDFTGGCQGDEIIVPYGTGVLYHLVMTNNGNVALSDTALVDSVYSPLNCNEGSIPSTLDVGESFTCTFNITPHEDVLNTATASGTGDSTTVEESDSVTVKLIKSGASAKIPTLSEWGVIIFSLFLAGVAVIVLRRRVSGV